MSAHTPGPWQYKPNSGQIIAPMVVYLADDGACGDNDCCGPPTYWVEIRPEDGRLIAAAPELLEALQDLVDVAQVLRAETVGDELDQEARVSRARAAIAKATGAAP